MTNAQDRVPVSAKMSRPLTPPSATHQREGNQQCVRNDGSRYRYERRFFIPKVSPGRIPIERSTVFIEAFVVESPLRFCGAGPSDGCKFPDIRFRLMPMPSIMGSSQKARRTWLVLAVATSYPLRPVGVLVSQFGSCNSTDVAAHSRHVAGRRGNRRCCSHEPMTLPD